MSKNVPSFLEKKPEPEMVQRMYHGETIQMWSGKVAVSAIQGWVDNPRIKNEIKKLRGEIGVGREITQEMVYEIMKKEAKIKVLRDNIRDNGLRDPLVLSFDGKLIDGNRRFFAIRYALDVAKAKGEALSRLERVDTFVLTKDAHEDQEQKILVEENFTSSLKEEWPYYVKARFIESAYEDGLSEEEIATKFGWSTSQVKDTIQILRIVEEFGAFARGAPNQEDPDGGGLGMTDQDVEDFVTGNYQMFNEAKKSLRTPLLSGKDPVFASRFYRWLREGKYKSFPEVRVAYQVWEDPEARDAMEKGGEDAGKTAKAVIDYKKRVVRDDTDAAHRISNFMDFLGKLTVEQMARMPEQVLDNLRKSLETVIEMTQSGKK